MASAVDIDTEELKICIKGLLISRPTVVNANLLLRDCEQELGQAFPYRKLGFSTFVDYLKSIPNVVKLEPQNSYNPDVYPVASKASQHVDELVSRQRVAPPRRRGVARRAIYNTRPAPRKRPTIREIPQPTRSVVRPAQGIDVRDLESHMTRNYDKRELTRNGIHNVDNLLSHIEGHVERRDTKVYPKLSGESNFESGSLNRSEQSYKVDSIPAGLEDDFDDFYDDDEFYLEETEKDSEEEMSNQAIKLWSRALGEKENGSSPRSSVSVQETVSLTSKEEVVDLNEKLAEDDTHISSAMIKNFRKILTEYPGGIWASQLQQLYFEQFHVTLDLIDLGYTSAISLASSLPSVFAFQREGSHDWKLYDARYVSQASLDTQKNKFDISLSERGFIPQVIIDNIKRLLDENPNGFRSTELLKKYFDTFRKPLDLEILGFRKLEEFLMILKDDITLKKVLDYYLLLPKHKVVSYEALQPPKPDERLNIPAEALCVPIPDMVMRPGEEIPLQELPPVLMDPDPTKPLLELQVVVAEVISPAHFYMTLASRHEELENMMDDLEKFYRWEEANFKIPLPYIAVNLFCATKYQEYWHRAKITRIKNHGDVEVEFIDYGTPGTVKNSELRYLSKEFSTLPAQALCAKLIGVKPCHGETKFPKEVCETFLSLVESKRLVAYVFEVASRVRYRKERMQLEVILYDVENQNPEIVINDYLIENGFASPITQEQESSEEQPTLQLLPERESVPSQANGFEMSLPVVGLSSHPENSSSSLPGNSSSTSLQASSVNRFINISRYLKHFVISRFSVKNIDQTQRILDKYTSCKCPVQLRNVNSNSSKPLTTGLTNGFMSGLDNSLRNGSKEVVTDSFDISQILAKMNEKRKSNLFSSSKTDVKERESNLDLLKKENVSTLSVLNSDGLTNDSCITNSNELNGFSHKNTPELLDCLETENNNNDVKHSNSGMVLSMNVPKTPNNSGCERNADIESPISHNIDKKLSNGSKSDPFSEIDVVAIMQKSKPKKLKDLFGKPTLPD